MITREIIQQFLKENKPELNCTQNKLCIPIINRIYKKMDVDIKFAEIKIAGNLICDGHHRYLASFLLKKGINTLPYPTTGATVPIDWESVEFVDSDWDTPEKIQMLNEKDASFNNMTVAELVELLN